MGAQAKTAQPDRPYWQGRWCGIRCCVSNTFLEHRPLQFNIEAVPENGAVAFCSKFIGKVPYVTKEYFTNHPSLSWKLIKSLIAKHVAIIVLDFSGMRNGAEHTPTEQYCADHDTFVVENACNIDAVLAGEESAHFTLGTYPVNFEGMSRLPCRVVARV